MRIAVDAMGGDSAPAAEVEGTVQSIPLLGGHHEVLLVGDEAKIRAAAGRLGGLPRGVSVVHASEVVRMDDHPVEAIRRKPDSSIARCFDLVTQGQADAVVSAGNTGAVVALAMFKLGLLEGCRRPGIGVSMPNRGSGHTLVIDCGANIKCTPENLLQYGVMAAAYAKHVFGRPSPKVGLLNIGEEHVKGNPLVKRANELLAASSLNYVGYVEGRDIFNGAADVVVCEGFVGNVLLKVSEGVAETIMIMIKEAITRTLRRRIGAMLCKYAMLEMAARVDTSEFGGAPLLGVNGICTISHGASDARAIANAIRRAAEATTHHVTKHMVAGLKACGLG